MILRILAMTAANLAVTLGAWMLLRRVRSGRPVLDALLFLLLRLLLVSAVVLATGLTRILDAATLGIAGALVLAGLLAWERPAWRRPTMDALPSIVVLLLVLRLAAQIWIFSPYVGDTLSYHLPKVADWVREAALTNGVGVDRRGWFPAGFELVETWWVVFLHHDVLIETAGVEFLLLGTLAAAALAEGLGLDRRACVWTGILFALTPGIHLGATSCLNDVPAAALVVTTFALVLARARVELVLLAVALGLGIKPTYGYALPGVAALAYLVRREPRIGGAGAATARVTLLLGVLVGSFWYLRNLWVHGNPIFPMGSAGYKNAGGVVIQQVGPSVFSLFRNLRILTNSRVYDLNVYGGLLEMTSGWGVGGFACGLPALLAIGRKGGGFGRLSISFLISVVSVLLLVSPDPWNMRFLLFFPAILALASVLLLRQAPALRYVLAVILTAHALGTMVPGEFQVNAVQDSWKQGWKRRRVAVIPYDPWTQEVVAAVPGATRAYLLYRPDLSARVVYLDEPGADALIRRMDREGARMLHGTLEHPGVAEAVERKLLIREPGNFFRRP